MYPAYESLQKNTKTEIERYCVAHNEQASLIKISIKGEGRFVFQVEIELKLFDWISFILTLRILKADD